MIGKITWITYKYEYLQYITEADETARVGFLFGRSVDTAINDTLINNIVALRTGKNEAFLPVKSTLVTTSGIAKCVAANIPMEVWTVDEESGILALDPYVSGVISNKLHFGKVLYNHYMQIHNID